MTVEGRKGVVSAKTAGGTSRKQELTNCMCRYQTGLCFQNAESEFDSPFHRKPKKFEEYRLERPIKYDTRDSAMEVVN